MALWWQERQGQGQVEKQVAKEEGKCVHQSHRHTSHSWNAHASQAKQYLPTRWAGAQHSSYTDVGRRIRRWLLACLSASALVAYKRVSQVTSDAITPPRSGAPVAAECKCCVRDGQGKGCRRWCATAALLLAFGHRLDGGAAGSGSSRRGIRLLHGHAASLFGRWSRRLWTGRRQRRVGGAIVGTFARLTTPHLRHVRYQKLQW